MIVAATAFYAVFAVEFTDVGGVFVVETKGHIFTVLFPGIVVGCTVVGVGGFQFAFAGKCDVVNPVVIAVAVLPGAVQQIVFV